MSASVAPMVIAPPSASIADVIAVLALVGDKAKLADALSNLKANRDYVDAQYAALAVDKDALAKREADVVIAEANAQAKLDQSAQAIANAAEISRQASTLHGQAAEAMRQADLVHTVAKAARAEAAEMETKTIYRLNNYEASIKAREDALAPAEAALAEKVKEYDAKLAKLKAIAG